MGQLVCILGAGLLWMAGWLSWTRDERFSKRARILLPLARAVIVVVATGVYHVSFVPSLLLSIAGAAFLGRSQFRRLAGSLRPERPVEQNS